jgi:D-aminopeptidase
MSEVTDLTVIEIKPEQAPVLYVAGGLDAYLEQIRQAVNEVPDLSTKKGRDRVASLAAQVSRSKTAIEKPGREYLKRLKEAVRPLRPKLSDSLMPATSCAMRPAAHSPNGKPSRNALRLKKP